METLLLPSQSCVFWWFVPRKTGRLRRIAGGLRVWCPRILQVQLSPASAVNQRRKSSHTTSFLGAQFLALASCDLSLTQLFFRSKHPKQTSGNPSNRG